MSGIELSPRYADDPEAAVQGYTDDPESGGEVFQDEGGLQAAQPPRRGSCLKTCFCAMLVLAAVGGAFGLGVGLDWDSILSGDGGDSNTNNVPDDTPAVAPPPPEGGIEPAPAEPVVVVPETPAEGIEPAAPETPESEISGVPPPEPVAEEPITEEAAPETPAEPEIAVETAPEIPTEPETPAVAAPSGYAGDGFATFSDVPIGSSGATVSLPEVTTQALQNDASPQAKALHWVSENYVDQLATMEDWRKQQIFAMASVFYAVGGDEWHDQSRVGWMDPLKPECSWCEKAQPCDGTNFTTELYLHGIEAELPAEIGLLTRLETLEFYHSRNLPQPVPFEDALPPQIARLAPTLTYFQTDKHGKPAKHMTGSVPERLWSLTKLTYLDLRENTFTGTISELMGGLTDLRFFDISYCKGFVGTFPTTIGNLRQMTSLDLGSNQLVLPDDQMAELTMLTNLALEWMNLRTEFPTWVTKMTNLEILDLGNNHLVGTLPTEMGLLTNLKEMHLHKNALTGKIPSQLGLLTQTKLVQFRLADNQFNGTLPLELLHLDPTEKFELLNNQLTGTIPTQIGLLSSVAYDVDFGKNKFHGTIPTQVGLLTGLQYRLDFNENKLTGTIPTELGGLDAEKYKGPLVVKHNKLVGPVPSELGLLTLAKQFMLEGNDFAPQELPAEFCNLPEGTMLDVTCEVLTCPANCLGYCQCK